jgi:hypothetical protein
MEPRRGNEQEHGGRFWRAMWRTSNAPLNLDACQRFAGHKTAAGRVRARRKPAPGESIHGLVPA